MDRATYEDYLVRHNAGDFAAVAERHFHPEIEIEVAGRCVARGRAAALAWLTAAAANVTSTLYAYDHEFDPNGLEAWADLYEWAECHRDGDSLFAGRMRAGEIRITPLRAHYITRGDRLGCMVLDLADGTIEIDRPGTEFAPLPSAAERPTPDLQRPRERAQADVDDGAQLLPARPAPAHHRQ
ncbi:hypothetical protein ACWDSJ_06975 [Nocardia sp. NPDC003482]